jgi:hypothetical protein
MPGLELLDVAEASANKNSVTGLSGDDNTSVQRSILFRTGTRVASL